MEGWNVTVGRERVDRGPVGNRVLASHPNFSQRGTPAFVRWRALVDPATRSLTACCVPRRRSLGYQSPATRYRALTAR